MAETTWEREKRIIRMRMERTDSSQGESSAPSPPTTTTTTTTSTTTKVSTEPEPTPITSCVTTKSKTLTLAHLRSILKRVSIVVQTRFQQTVKHGLTTMAPFPQLANLTDVESSGSDLQRVIKLKTYLDTTCLFLNSFKMKRDADRRYVQAVYMFVNNVLFNLPLNTDAFLRYEKIEHNAKVFIHLLKLTHQFSIKMPKALRQVHYSLRTQTEDSEADEQQNAKLLQQDVVLSESED